MLLFQRIRIHSYEVGLEFRDGEFRGLLGEGSHWYFDPFGRVKVEVVSKRAPRLVHEKLDLIVASGELKGRALVVDLKDDQRGLLWIDGRFAGILAPGLYAYWAAPRTVRLEVVSARRPRFEHEDLQVIVANPTVAALLETVRVGRDHVGVLALDGQYADTLAPGLYAFWRGTAEVRVTPVDLREATIEVGGQEIMTADKVTLRLNALVSYRVALVSYRVADPRRAVGATEDARQALYREIQMALRAVLGARDLDALLADKQVVARETEELLRDRAGELGLTVLSAGLRDIILPGDMKELMNKVTEAKKAAEADLITRREETAALRSQANSAKLLEDNPVLMRLRELQVLENVAAAGKLNIVLGEKGLADRIVNLI